MLDITPKWARVLTVPVVVFIAMCGVALLYNSFLSDIANARIVNIMLGVVFLLFAKFMSKLIPFLSLKAKLEDDHLFIQNKDYTAKFSVNELHIKFHRSLQYVEIFSNSGQLVFACDYVYDKSMNLVYELVDTQNLSE